MKSKLFSIFCFVLPLFLAAEIHLQTPADKSVLPLLPENQKKLLSMPSHGERVKVLVSDKQLKEKSVFFRKGLLWRKPLPIVFKWKDTENQSVQYRLSIADNPEFKNAKVFFSKKAKNSLPYYLLNLKLGQTYYWKVKGKKDTSAVFSFTTEEQPPRWIAIEGNVSNMRDLGGWKTTDGKRVKQGLLFRGQGLNFNSGDGTIPGRNRLMVEDIELLCGELGIKTELDLRSFTETANMKKSPLGDQVKFIQIPSSAYTGIHKKSGHETMGKEFKILADPKNLPLYFHCIGGYDRTGALAFVANGLLGVSEKDLASDWEATSLPNLPDMGPEPQWRDYNGMVNGFNAYGQPGDPLSKKIELYLLAAGVTSDEIATFRKTMLENP